MLPVRLNQAKRKSADPAYTEKVLPVVRESLDTTETAAVRCYGDMPNVPYMSVTEFYNRFYLENTDLTEGMSFTREGDAYTLTNFCGDTAVFDIAADTIVLDDMTRFIKLACDLQSANTEGPDPDYPYAGITHSTDPAAPVPKAIALKDYSIDLRGDDTGVYAPLPTLADLFAAPSGFYVVYVGGKIYVRDNLGLYMHSVMTDDPDYFTAVKADRPADLAQYTYNELCLSMDLWYGKPGQEFIHEDLLTSKLDEVLTEKFPEIKEKLLGSDFESFYGGLIHLFGGLLFDGGHTGMGCDELADDELELSTKLYREMRAMDYGTSYNLAAGRYNNKAVRLERADAFYNGETYVEQGDTAVICIGEDFLVDVDGWKAFYAGQGERPLEDDTASVVLAGLERASKNPEIKNIIIDDSNNGGGNDIAMLAIEWMMTGTGYVRDWDALNSQYNIKAERFDINFDGKVDEGDVSPYTGYRYGILTSEGSFSCGNAFPWFMHEHGAMILGQKSSGGACGIRISSVGGIEVRNSAATSCTVTEDGGTVDNGCPIDASLTTDGEDPYERFYDIDAFSRLMDEFFDGAA